MWVSADVSKKHAVSIFRAEVTKLGSGDLIQFEEGRLRQRGQLEKGNMGESVQTNRDPSSRLERWVK